MSVARHADMRPLPSATQATFGWDPLRVATFAAHLLFVVYVSIGWTSSTRIGLLFYLLLLPVIVMQWLLNGGVSILDNAETLIRTSRWRDARNRFEGRFFQNMLCAAGIRVSTTLINVLVCVTLLIFWIDAFYRMIMIRTAP